VANLLITGATGMLGSYVLRMAQSWNGEVIAPSRSQLDLNDAGSIDAFIKKLKPRFVLHLAAQTNVDLCERDPAEAAKLNVFATQEIAKATANVGGWLGYVSTSNVFGVEQKVIYNELDLPNPVNYYGRSKLWGEHVVAKYLPFDHLIVRAAWLIGGGAGKDHKFVGKIVSQIRDGSEELKAVDDKYGTITVAEDLAAFLLASANERRCGIFHFASKGVVTRFEIAAKIAQTLGYRGSLTPVKSNLFPLSAPRPASEGIESVFLSAVSKEYAPRQWQDDLEKYILQF
jgi:dTDP-4-dehydrorhamnose reductase